LKGEASERWRERDERSERGGRDRKKDGVSDAIRVPDVAHDVSVEVGWR